MARNSLPNQNARTSKSSVQCTVIVTFAVERPYWFVELSV